MDELDARITSELQNRGFQKSSVLAAQFGVGERTIRRRMNRIRQEGNIRIIAIPNPILAGQLAWAKIGIKLAPRSLVSAANQLVEHPSVYMVAYTTGMFDIEAVVQFRTLDELCYFVNLELKKIDGIVSTETILMVWPRKFYSFSWPLSSFTESVGPRPQRPDNSGYTLDAIDRQILTDLNQDAFTPIKVIKSKLDIGENAIRTRIRAMQKHNAFKIVVLPGPRMLEKQIWAAIGLQVNRRYTNEMISRMVENSSVYFASLALGRMNILIAARFPSMELYNEFADVQLGKIRGIINVEKYLYTKLLKYHTIKLIT